MGEINRRKLIVVMIAIFSVIAIAYGFQNMMDYIKSKSISVAEDNDLLEFITEVDDSNNSLDVEDTKDDEGKNKTEVGGKDEVKNLKKNNSVKKNQVYRFNDTINFKELSRINPDTFGWIRNTATINNPVVVSSDGQDYLKKSFYGKKSLAGTIFTLGNTKITDDNISLYGHTMGRYRTDFFASLHKYREKEYREMYSEFQLLTEDVVKTYKVTAIFEMDIANDLFNPFVSNFYTPNSKRTFYNEIKNKSEFGIGHEFSEDDNYLTLMTCLHGARDITDRLILIAVEI